MKTLPAGMQDLLDSGATTLAYCWRITRSDGVIQGFTEHDLQLTFDSTTFEASTGFTATAIETELGLNVDNLNADGAISSETITEQDLAAGEYDDAEIELFWVNFEDVNMRVTIMRGSIGEVKRFETQFSAELRSLTHKLQQKTGRTYQRYCDANLGDDRCQVNLAGFSENSSVLAVSDNRIITAPALTNAGNGYYSYGLLTFTSGLNNGLSFEIKVHYGDASILELWAETPFTISGGDAFTISAGCGKDPNTCKAKFNNIVNFQGFQFIPGNDFVTRFPNRGGSSQDGGSIFS